MNFIPKMDKLELVKGYKNIVNDIYSPKNYYERVITFLKEFKPGYQGSMHFEWVHISALIKSILRLGIIGRERWYYWKLMFWSLFKRPKALPLAVTLSIYGYHFRRVFEKSKFDSI